MLKLKLQYFGNLMWRADSFEKTLMLYSVIHNSSFILSVAKVMTVLILDKAGFREEFYQG